MVTKKGVIKRTDINEYNHIRQSGIIAINLDEGDEFLPKPVSETVSNVYPSSEAAKPTT